MRNVRGSAVPYAIVSLFIVAAYLTLRFASGPLAVGEQTVEHAGTWVGAVVVLWATFIAVQQLKDARRATRATTFLEIMRRYQSEKMQSARKDIFGLTQTDDLKGSYLTVCRFYEEVGTLVRFEGLEFEVVNSYLNTRIIKAYERLKPFIAERRAGDARRAADPYAWKYFEWLALRCIARSPGPDPEWTRMRDRYKSRRVGGATVVPAVPPPLSESPAPGPAGPG